jgi:hypothetical protein
MSEMAALSLFFQDMTRTPPFALGENTKRGGWEDHQEHLPRRKESGGYHQRYPLIQYKLEPQKGINRPMLLCLEQGVEGGLGSVAG